MALESGASPLISECDCEPTGNSDADKVLIRLSKPTSSAVLVEDLEFSRQRMDWLLKGLLKAGKVTRVMEPWTQGCWVWLRSELNVTSAMQNYVPALPDGRRRVLNALEPDAWHWVVHIAEATGQAFAGVGKQADKLEERGLAVSLRLGQRHYVRITPRGLDHPSRSDGPRAQIADMSKVFVNERIVFIEVLAVLGEARTVDITGALVSDERAGEDLMSGRLMHELLKSDLVEQVPGSLDGHPCYRLTEAGCLAATLIAQDRTPPNRETLEERIRSFRASRAERRLSKRSETFSPTARPAPSAIVEALSKGPLSTSVFQEAIAANVRHPRSIHNMLLLLQKRGVIRQAGKDGLTKRWELADSTSPSIPKIADRKQRSTQKTSSPKVIWVES